MSAPALNARVDAAALLEGRAETIDLMKLIGDGYVPTMKLTARDARHLGYVLIALASESDIQSGYLMALRSHKISEKEIEAIMLQATDMIMTHRAHQ